MLTHRGPGTRERKTGLRPPRYKRFRWDATAFCCVCLQVSSSCATTCCSTAPACRPWTSATGTTGFLLVDVDPAFPAESDCQGLQQRDDSWGTLQGSLWQLWQRAGWLDQPDGPGHWEESHRSWFTSPRWLAESVGRLFGNSIW